MPNVIRVAKATDNDPIKVEKPAVEAILPGNILLANSSGQFKKHDVANGGGMLFVADVNMLDGVAEAYAINDTVQAYQPVSGETYLVRAATGQALVKDITALTSTGAGRVDIGTVGTDVIIAYAAETVTTSANDQLVLVKFK
jgi:delta-aminolevulinic acid dehydratase/porphobilinogen synthase